MGTSILKGITIGLLVTVLTLLTVLVTTLAGIDETIIAYLVDFGLLLSCLTAGFRASRDSGRLLPAGLAAGGYAVAGILLLALYFPIESLGAVKIISEGIGLGLLAGVLGTGFLGSERVSYGRLNNIPHPNSLMRSKWPLEEDRKFTADIRSNPSWYGENPDAERTRIYELCSKKPELTDEEEAFNWWEVETKKQLRRR
jgi:hypothetical protein